MPFEIFLTAAARLLFPALAQAPRGDNVEVDFSATNARSGLAAYNHRAVDTFQTAC